MTPTVATDNEGDTWIRSLLVDARNITSAHAALLYTPGLPPSHPSSIQATVGIARNATPDYFARFEAEMAAEMAATHATGAVIVRRQTLVIALASHVGSDETDAPDHADMGPGLTAIVDDGCAGTLPHVRITVVRNPADPEFSPIEIGRLEGFSALARSLLRLKLQHQRTSSTVPFHQSTIDLIRMPLFLVDGERQVLLANRAAHALPRSDGQLVVRAGKLQSVERTTDRSIADAVRQAMEMPHETRFVRLGPGRPLRPAPALALTAIHADVAGPAGQEREIAVLIRVLHPDMIRSEGEMLLIRLLGLTPAESAVAMGLAEGLSHMEIAKRRDVAVATVRTVLRRVQQKLGIEKSGPLARFIHGISMVGGLRF